MEDLIPEPSVSELPVEKVKWYILKEDEDDFSYQIFDNINFLGTIELTGSRFDAFEFELKFSLLIHESRVPDLVILKCQDYDIVKPLFKIQATYEQKGQLISIQRNGKQINRVKYITLAELLA